MRMPISPISGTVLRPGGMFPAGAPISAPGEAVLMPGNFGSLMLQQSLGGSLPDGFLALNRTPCPTHADRGSGSDKRVGGEELHGRSPPFREKTETVYRFRAGCLSVPLRPARTHLHRAVEHKHDPPLPHHDHERGANRISGRRVPVLRRRNDRIGVRSDGGHGQGADGRGEGTGAEPAFHHGRHEGTLFYPGEHPAGDYPEQCCLMRSWEGLAVIHEIPVPHRGCPLSSCARVRDREKTGSSHARDGKHHPARLRHRREDYLKTGRVLEGMDLSLSS